MSSDHGIGLSLGTVDMLTKPVDRARLTGLIQRLVRRRSSTGRRGRADAREMIAHMMEKMGFTVAEAANGR